MRVRLRVRGGSCLAAKFLRQAHARIPGATAGSKALVGPDRVTSCGTPAFVRVDGQAITVGSCSGVFLVPAQQVTVQVGQQVDVRMTEEPAGPSGNQLVPIFPLPRSSRPAVLADGTVRQDRASGPTGR